MFLKRNESQKDLNDALREINDAFKKVRDASREINGASRKVYDASGKVNGASRKVRDACPKVNDACLKVNDACLKVNDACWNIPEGGRKISVCFRLAFGIFRLKAVGYKKFFYSQQTFDRTNFISKKFPYKHRFSGFFCLSRQCKHPNLPRPRFSEHFGEIPPPSQGFAYPMNRRNRKDGKPAR